MKSNAIQSNLICPTQFLPACLNKSIYYVQFLEANKLDINTISATLYCASFNCVPPAHMNFIPSMQRYFNELINLFRREIFFQRVPLVNRRRILLDVL